MARGAAWVRDSGGSAIGAGARRWTPLALTLGLHLLLVLAWIGAARDPQRREPPQRVAVFVQLRPPAQSLARPQAAPIPPAPAPARMPRPARGGPTLPVFPSPSPAIAVRAPEPAVADAPSDPVATAAGDAPADPSAPQQAPAPGALLAGAKAMAGRVDRELRKGASPITAEPERKWERFAEAFAAARTSVSHTGTLESYTSPDGVIFYRKKVGGRVACYRSGSVGGLVTGFGPQDGQGAGSTGCPVGVQWTRH